MITVTDVQLSVPERAALLALMTLVTAASNGDVSERYGFVIKKPVRDRLEAEGYLIATKGKRNSLVHELTDKGWARCRDELTNPLPRGSHRGYRVLYGVLGSLDKYLTTTGLTLADFFEPQAKPAADDIGSPDDRLRAAYDELVARPGAWVGLTRLREVLPDVSRSDFDDALLRLDLLPNVSLIPEVNQKSLTAADRAAAIHVGGEDKHLLQIRPA